MIFALNFGKMLPMKVLITGGAGYIGSHLVDRFLAEGAFVTAIDNLSSGRRRNVEHNLECSRFRFVEGDVMDRPLTEELVAEHDLVCHLAAIVGVPRVLADPLKCIRHTVLGTEIVLALAHKYGRRVLFASSSEVYGKSSQETLSEDGDRVLGATPVPRWAYATSKALDEHLCFAYCGRGLDVSIVRYFNSYGPRVDVRGYASVIGTLTAQALAGKPLTVHHDGQQSRSFTYVADTVQGSLAAATKDEALGEALNIGSEVETTILDVARLILRLTQSDSDIAFVPYAQAYGFDFEDPRRRVPDVRKAERLLGFRAAVPLEEGLQQTIDWFQDTHPWDSW